MIHIRLQRPNRRHVRHCAGRTHAVHGCPEAWCMMAVLSFDGARQPWSIQQRFALESHKQTTGCSHLDVDNHIDLLLFFFSNVELTVAIVELVVLVGDTERGAQLRLVLSQHLAGPAAVSVAAWQHRRTLRAVAARAAKGEGARRGP